MKVIDIRTRTVLDVEACYGARLIGQGRAVLAPAEPAKPAKEPEPEKAEEPEEPKAEEAPKSKAKKKG